MVFYITFINIKNICIKCAEKIHKKHKQNKGFCCKWSKINKNEIIYSKRLTFLH